MEKLKEKEDRVVYVPQGNQPVMIVLTILFMVGAFFLGSLWTKVQILEKGGVGVKTQQNPATTPAPQGPTRKQVQDVFTQARIKFGDEKSKLVFIEVADPSCPYCHIAAGKNGTLNKQVGDRFTLVADGGTYIAPVLEMKKLVDQKKASFAYLYSPGHGNGEMGTKALYCAYEKGKFWEVHDLLMTSAGYDLLNSTVKNDKQKSPDLVAFLATATNVDDLKKCLESGKYDSRLGEDSKLATSLGISGTPGFFINENKFAGAYSYKDMESAVTAALSK